VVVEIDTPDSGDFAYFDVDGKSRQMYAHGLGRVLSIRIKALSEDIKQHLETRVIRVPMSAITAQPTRYWGAAVAAFLDSHRSIDMYKYLDVVRGSEVMIPSHDPVTFVSIDGTVTATNTIDQKRLEEYRARIKIAITVSVR
jgi:hypothetical protein